MYKRQKVMLILVGTIISGLYLILLSVMFGISIAEPSNEYIEIKQPIVIDQSKEDLESLLDVTKRNAKECREIDQHFGELAEKNISINLWKRWMIRKNICIAYEDRVEQLQQKWDNEYRE